MFANRRGSNFIRGKHVHFIVACIYYSTVCATNGKVTGGKLAKIKATPNSSTTNLVHVVTGCSVGAALKGMHPKFVCPAGCTRGRERRARSGYIQLSRHQTQAGEEEEILLEEEEAKAKTCRRKKGGLRQTSKPTNQQALSETGSSGGKRESRDRHQ